MKVACSVRGGGKVGDNIKVLPIVRSIYLLPAMAAGWYTFHSKKYPFMTANIDAICRLPDGRLCVFEAKTTTYWNKDAWKEEKIPRHYIGQCRQYPTVLDDPRIIGTYIACLYGNTPSDFRCKFIERDEYAEKSLIDREAEFWYENVLKGIPPEKDGDPEKEIDFMQRLYGKSDPTLKPIEYDASFVELADEYMDVSAILSKFEQDKKPYEERKTAITAAFVDLLGKSVLGLLPISSDEKYDIAYKPKASRTVQYDRLKLLYPEIYKECVFENPESSRTFSMKRTAIR